ncbi:MAG: response regulator [Burkholderiales bacterium]|jgi:DNA-binding NtrC family response regulator|nr:response regulator [Burkholderiales bacterium]MCE1176335.1 response regulator [Burkholderiales bacterium]
MANILVVDDEMGIRELLAEILYDEGHVVLLAENAEQARQLRNRSRPDLVLLDIWMPDTDGVTLLKEWALSGQLNMPVIMMSGHASIDTAVEATRIGALDFLEKPITLQRLLHTVQQGLSRSLTPDIKEVVAQMSSNASKNKTETIATEDSTTPSVNENTSENTETSSASVAALSPSAQLLAQIDLTLELREARDSFERIYFEYHLERENANITRVAEKTGLERTHLYRKLKQLGIPIIKSNKR